MGAPVEGCRPGVHDADQQIMVAWSFLIKDEYRRVIGRSFGSSARAEAVVGDDGCRR